MAASWAEAQEKVYKETEEAAKVLVKEASVPVTQRGGPDSSLKE